MCVLVSVQVFGVFAQHMSGVLEDLKDGCCDRWLPSLCMTCGYNFLPVINVVVALTEDKLCFLLMFEKNVYHVHLVPEITSPWLK